MIIPQAGERTMMPTFKLGHDCSFEAMTAKTGIMFSEPLQLQAELYDKQKTTQLPEVS